MSYNKKQIYIYLGHTCPRSLFQMISWLSINMNKKASEEDGKMCAFVHTQQG